jgi:hypothetical protein
MARFDAGNWPASSDGSPIVTPGVGGYSAVVAASFVRPADSTTYASGDLVANSTTAASVVPLSLALARVTGGTGLIVRARLKKTSTGITNAVFRVHFYRDDPSASSGITNGDNGAWLTKEANHVGSIDITMDKVFSDFAKGSGVPKVSDGNLCNLVFDAATGSQTIYALIEARAAYAPISGETFTLAVEVLRD